MYMLSFYMFFFIILTFLTYFLLLNSSKIGLITNLLDYPSKGKLQKKVVPTIGGLIIFLNLIIFFFYFISLKNNIVEFKSLLFISFFFLLGLIDDKYNLNSKYRIFILIFISFFFIFFDNSLIIDRIYFSFINSEFYFGKFKIPVTIICIVFFYIAMNMMDGINGLLILFSFFSIIIYNFLIFNSFVFDLFSLVILLNLFLMFFFNYNNKVFLGNSGASLLSGYFIYLLITKNYNYKYDVLEIISVPLIMGIDMVRIFFFRILNNKNILDRDNYHFHHVLLNNFGLLNSLIIYLILSIGPIIFSKITNINIIYFILVSVFFYFIFLNYNKKFK
jgi:UDP-GlcNAc:undecaprenyl-phosphate GlcNAc-1-phosphate transferase